MSISGKVLETTRKILPVADYPSPGPARADALWHFGVVTLALAFLRFCPVLSHSGFMVCGFHRLTGRPCPLCGMTRALVCLTKGDWISAVQFNPLSPLVLGILLATIGSAVLQFFAPDFSYPADFGFRRDKWWTACLALFAVYGVLRISCLVP
jgi:uncharacterized protein DUF2752